MQCRHANQLSFADCMLGWCNSLLGIDVLYVGKRRVSAMCTFCSNSWKVEHVPEYSIEADYLLICHKFVLVLTM